MTGFHFVILYKNESKTRAFPLAYPDGHIRFFLTESDARQHVEDDADEQGYGYEIHCMGAGEK